MKLSKGIIILIAIVIYFTIFAFINVGKEKKIDKEILDKVIYVSDGKVKEENEENKKEYEDIKKDVMTELKKEFCRRHAGEIYEFTVDVLTCNEGELEMFILSELEKLLADNHIFSSNAVVLKGLMSKHSFLNTTIRSIR